MEDFAGGEAEAGSPPSTAQMPSNERRQVRIALAPSRIVASTLSRAVRRRRGHLRLPPRCLRTNDAGCFAPAPSRIVASTLVSCRQAGARPATPRREKKGKE